MKERSDQDEAANAFMCMHCKAARRYARPILTDDVLDALEKRLEDKFGRPEPRLRNFSEGRQQRGILGHGGEEQLNTSE